MLRHPGCVPDVRSIRRVDADDARVARATGHVLRPVAHASLTPDGPGCWVGPAAVPLSHPLARVDGVGNAVRLHGEPCGDVLLAGPGAGGDATAISLLDDVLAVVDGRGSYAESRSEATSSVEPPASPWLVTLGPAPRGPQLDETLDFVAGEGLRFRTLHEVALPSGPVLAGITRPLTAPVVERATSTVLTVGAVRTARAFRALPATV